MGMDKSSKCAYNFAVCVATTGKMDSARAACAYNRAVCVATMQMGKINGARTACAYNLAVWVATTSKINEAATMAKVY